MILAGTTTLTDNPRPTVAGARAWTAIVLQPFVTTDATPTTPALLQLSLAVSTSIVIGVQGHAIASDGYELRSMPPGAAVVGTEIVIANVSDTFSFTLMHDHASGTAGGRFFMPDGLDITLAPFEQVWGVLRESAGRIGWWLQL